ncbi:hypothetical protein MED121_16804 [Marinomonas sp. MED121]|nr:hypothetical protein MED121_16804 [Marinomonas sp. MED121]
MKKLIALVFGINRVLVKVRCWLFNILKRTEFLGTLVMLVKLVNEIKKFLGY